jgi:hypothetical protein
MLLFRPDAIYQNRVTVTLAHMIHKLVATREALDTEVTPLDSAVESRARAVK